MEVADDRASVVYLAYRSSQKHPGKNLVDIPQVGIKREDAIDLLFG